LEGGPQEREPPVTLDPPQERLDVEQGGGNPAVVLIGRAPGGDAAEPPGEMGIDGLQTVGGLEAYAGLGEEAQAMQGERLPEGLLPRTAGVPPQDHAGGVEKRIVP
jgi:hypothetical protein